MVLGLLLACLMLFAGTSEASHSLTEHQENSGLEWVVDQEAARPESRTWHHQAQRLGRARTQRRQGKRAGFARPFAFARREAYCPASPRAPPHQPRAPPVA
ncbi:MAG: hypothetical protein VKP62_04080 [Candidatus Sericytochromatia bacterium]|nr:hypothetical protein [Candidatus Sericytochromatia bacterium]